MPTLQPNILVIDDEPAILRTLSTALRLEGYTCATETDPTAALMRMERELFHIVLTDVVMPEMDGLELVRRLKQGRSPCEVIVMTAHTTLERAVEAHGLGVSDYLLKPFESLDELRDVVRRAANRLARWREIMGRSLSPRSESGRPRGDGGSSGAEG